MCTSTAEMPAGRASGAYASELVDAWEELTQAGLDPLIASPAGGPVPIEARRVGHPAEDAFFGGIGGSRTAASLGIDELTPVANLVFVVGGHSAVLDLTDDRRLVELLVSTWHAGGVIAAVCHGVAALLSATDRGGQPLLRGRRVTAFSAEEEAAVGMASRMPWLITDRLAELGAEVSIGPPFLPHHVADGRIVTGQNPASARGTARAAVAALVANRPDVLTAPAYGAEFENSAESR